MTAYFITAALYSLVCVAGFVAVHKSGETYKIENSKKWLAAVLLAGFAIRLQIGIV